MIDQFIQGMPVMNTIWNTLKFLDPVPLGLAGSDHLSANVELPFAPGLLPIARARPVPTNRPQQRRLARQRQRRIRTLRNSPRLDHRRQFSAVEIRPPHRSSRLPPISPTPSTPVDPTKIIVSSQAHMDLIRSLGGEILNGQVLLPSLLMDPGNTFNALPPLPQNPLQLPGYIGDLATILSSYSQFGRIQIFVPSPETLLKFNFINFTGDGGPSPRIAPSDAFLAESTAQQTADLQHLIDSIYLEGVLNAKILGIQLANGTINASATSFNITGAIPWLLNLQTTFGIAFAPRPIPRTTFVTLFGRQPAAAERNADGTANIQLPVVSAVASISTKTDVNAATDLATLLQGWGLPTQYFTSFLPSGGASCSRYSPAFDPTSTDPLLRNGGIEFDADLRIPALLARSSFKFALSPPTGTNVLPDFTATVNGAVLQSIGGLTIQNALVQVIKSGNNLGIHIDGTAQFLGTNFHVFGNLNPDSTGFLTMQVVTGTGVSIGGVHAERVDDPRDHPHR